MKWIRIVAKNVYDPTFYREAVRGKAPAPTKYFLCFMVLVAMLTAIPTFISFFSWMSRPEGFQSLYDSVIGLYPDDLVLRYQDGHVTSNVEEPYPIAMPESLRDSAITSDGRPFRNLLVIDTTHAIVPEDFTKYDTVAIIGSTAFWTNDPQKGIRVNRFDAAKVDAFTLDKGTVSDFARRLEAFLRPILVVLAILLPVIVFSGLTVGYLAYMLVGALLVLVVGKVRHVDLSYGQSYRIGLRLLTVPVFYGLLRSLFPVIDVPFMFSAILIAFAYINLEPVGETSATTVKEEKE